MPETRLWIGGWGIPPETLRRKLGAIASDDVILPPTAEAVRKALAASPNVTLAGWSLGARLLLEAVAAGRLAPDRKLVLVCPFIAFPAEAGVGGRAALTQVRYLRRWVKRDAPGALADFRSRAGIAESVPDTSPVAVEILDEGLDTLESVAVFDVPALPRARLLGGANDALIDNTRLKNLLPGLRIIPGAGHDIADFVKALDAGG